MWNLGTQELVILAAVAALVVAVVVIAVRNGLFGPPKVSKDK
jgi:hypothetical protein